MSKVKRIRTKIALLEVEIARMTAQLEQYEAGNPVVKALFNTTDKVEQLASALIFRKGYREGLMEALKEYS